MNILHRLKRLERRLGPYTEDDLDQARDRQFVRLENLLYGAGISPDHADISAPRIMRYIKESLVIADLSIPKQIDVNLPKPDVIDMSPKSFARDQDIIDEVSNEFSERIYFALGRSEQEMWLHFWGSFFKTMDIVKERRAQGLGNGRNKNGDFIGFQQKK